MKEQELKEIVKVKEEGLGAEKPIKQEDSTLLVFDTETTGLPTNLSWETDYNQFPHIVQIAWDKDGQEQSFIIKPDGYEIPKDMIHGISQERAMKEGVAIEIILGWFINLALQSGKLVAHNIYFDTSIIKANALRVGFPKDAIIKAFDKSKRYDTMKEGQKYLSWKKWPKLGELYYELFNKYIENQHTALADVRATKECYEELIKRV